MTPETDPGTPHTHDVRGMPWRPCSVCPNPTPGSCPSRFHRPLCGLVAEDPGTWGPKVAAMPACDHPAPERPARSTVVAASAPRQPRRPRPRRPGEPVRVVFWTPAFYRGGAERWHLDLIRALDPRRVRVVGVAIDRRSLTDADMVAELGTLAPVGYGSAVAVEWARSADVVVTWGPLPRADMAGLDPRPSLVTVSHGDSRCPYTTGWIAEAAPHTDHFVACAATGLDTIPEPSRPDATALHNGADPGRVAPTLGRAEARAAWGVPEGAKVLGYLGRFATTDKRADLVAGVAAHLPSDWWVVLVGDGWAARQVAEIAARTPRTRIIPWMPRSGDALVGFDMLANPSAIEGFGLTQVEAMMAGVPVVGTATGIAAELPELLSGRIPTDATAGQLAAEVLRVAGDVEGTAAVVARARSVALERFTAEAFAGRWADYFEGIAPGGAEAAPAPVPAPIPATTPTPTAPVVVPASPGRYNLAQQRALITECDYRGHVIRRPSCGCESEVRYCALGKGFFPNTPHEVRFSDCLACIKSRS